MGEFYYKYRGDGVAAETPYDPLIGRVIHDFCGYGLKRIPRSVLPRGFIIVLVSVPISVSVTPPVAVGTVIGASFFVGKEFLLHPKASAAKSILAIDADVSGLLYSHDIKVRIR